MRSPDRGVFELFSRRARKAMALARKEAQWLRHDCIGPEHIFLGAMSVSGVAQFMFNALGGQPGSLRTELEARLGRGRSPAPRGTIPFTLQARQVIEKAVLEARELGHSIIGPEHLLLGIVCGNTSNPVVEVTEMLGVDPDELRAKVLDVVSSGVGQDQVRSGRGCRQVPVIAHRGMEVLGSWKSCLGAVGALVSFGGTLLVCLLFPTFDKGKHDLYFLIVTTVVAAILGSWSGGLVGARIDRRGESNGHYHTIDHVRAEIEASHAEELKNASVWRRIWIRWRIRWEISKRMKEVAPPGARYLHSDPDRRRQDEASADPEERDGEETYI